MLKLDKFSLVVTTRCNLRCQLCDEFIPTHKPFPDMTVQEADRILTALFQVADHVELLHLSGGGEPFLNPVLPELVDQCFRFSRQFDRLMVFTNSTILPSEQLLDALARHRDQIIVHASNYGLKPERSQAVYQALRDREIPLREIKYYGEDQDYGGWVDFGSWEARGRTGAELNQTFVNCGITKYMRGNWRTRDGKVHWCQRSQRGMELGILPDSPEDYVDLLDDSRTVEEKRMKFEAIAHARALSACDHCSGDHGTEDPAKRFPAGQQIK